ncbi:MAG: gephyrin-like molybdotransferase Glp [Bacillota bacterium]|jgi:molybdopterin molybdotransferase
MIDFFRVLTVDEARERLFDSWKVTPMSCTRVGLQEALGRVLAKDVISDEHIPPYSRSTVDGYAVMAKDTFGATQSLPAVLSLVMDIHMGEVPTGLLLPGQAARIPTGGVLPQGADACAMIEHTEALDGQTILLERPLSPGENIILRGEDIGKNEMIMKSGTVLRPQDLGSLAALGVTEVVVRKRPRVAVIATGDEIVPPNTRPAPGQIRDMNSYSVAAMAKSFGAEPSILGIAKDTYDDVRRLVEIGLTDTDFVTISGGTSVGTRDVVKRVLADLGPPGVIVHGVAVRPGKPVILAVTSGKPVLGLPGHPVSAMVAFNLFGKVILEALLDAKIPEQYVDARLSRNVASAPGRQDHIRVSLREQDGTIWADPVLGKSGLMATMVTADGEIVIATEKEGLLAGSLVRVRVF